MCGASNQTSINFLSKEKIILKWAKQRVRMLMLHRAGVEDAIASGSTDTPPVEIIAAAAQRKSKHLVAISSVRFESMSARELVRAPAYTPMRAMANPGCRNRFARGGRAASVQSVACQCKTHGNAGRRCCTQRQTTENCAVRVLGKLFQDDYPCRQCPQQFMSRTCLSSSPTPSTPVLNTIRTSSRISQSKTRHSIQTAYCDR